MTYRFLSHVAAAATVTAALASARAHAAPTVQLSQNTRPHPITRPLSIPVEGRVSTYDLGYRSCHGYALRQPTLSLQITERLPDLLLRLTNPAGGPVSAGFMLVDPKKGYFCGNRVGEVRLKDVAPGTYQVYLYGERLSKLSGVLRVEIPSVSARQLTDGLSKLPRIDTTDARLPNPRFLQVEAGVAVEAQIAGVSGCAGRSDRVVPVARLEVAQPTRYLLHIPKHRTVLSRADVGCWKLDQVLKLDAGSYVVWAVLERGEDRPTLELEVDDRARALRFSPSVTRKPLGDLSAPMVIDGVVRPAESWGHRSFTCRGAAREPDFYMTSDRPLQNVLVSLLWGRKPQALHILGPVETLGPNHVASCDVADKAPARYDVLEGTYAVWVGSKRGDAAGSAYRVLVRSGATEVEPLTTFGPIPDDLSLAERAVTNHYPFLDTTGALQQLFANAPDELLAYARTDVPGSSDAPGLRVGEPLLVAWSNDRSSLVRRYDGASVRVDTRLISTERPGAVWLPTTPTLPKIESLSRAIDHAGPEDKGRIAAFRKVESKGDACVGNYMAKHDPTWNHADIELFKISGSGKVTNVSDEVFKRAKRKCGYAKVERHAKKLIRELATSRKARAVRHLAAVRARFGV